MTIERRHVDLLSAGGTQLSAPAGCMAATGNCLAQGHAFPGSSGLSACRRATLLLAHVAELLEAGLSLCPACIAFNLSLCPLLFLHRSPPNTRLPQSISVSASGGSTCNRFHHSRASGREGPYLEASGLVLPPLEGGQVATQPCAQVVEEDHVEWDTHQGVEDTEDLACLCAGCQVPIACRGGGAYKCGEERVQNCLPHRLEQRVVVFYQLWGGGEGKFL